MAIKKMELTGLTAFEKATFEFVPGINVLLGANSTGKTHALKWLYASTKAFSLPVAEGETGEARVRPRLGGVFHPDELRIGRLLRASGKGYRGVAAIWSDVHALEITVGGDDSIRVLRPQGSMGTPVTFIPSREVLALYEGFVSAYTNRELSIDETYFDACVALNASLLRGPKAEVLKPFVESVEALLGGKVELVGERFYVTFRDAPSTRLEAHLVAEGLRKIASIVRLLQNGSIAPGGLLVWDEPEANLNSRLVAALVPIVEALAKAGVQIVLATHDYLLAKRLSLISEVEAADRPSVKFFLLSRPAVGAPIEIASGPTLADLPQTPMEAEFLKLYDDERRAYAGG